MPDSGALSPLKRRPPGIQAESPENALPKEHTLELPARRSLNDLPTNALRNIVNRLASQPRDYVRARTMLTVIEANEEVRKEVRYSRPIIDARSRAVKTEGDLQRDWKSIDSLIETFETFNAGAPQAAKESVAARLEKVAFSRMEPLPPTGGGLQGREETSSAPPRATLQDIKQRINAFHQLTERQRHDLVTRVLHLPNAEDYDEMRELLAQELAEEPRKEQIKWSEQIWSQDKSIRKAKQELYKSTVSELANAHVRDLLGAEARIAEDFPHLFVESRNAVFKGIMGARDDLARLRGINAMAGHVDVLDPAQKASLFKAVKHAVARGRFSDVQLTLEKMALHLSEFSVADQENFVQLVLKDPAVKQKLPLMGRLLSGSDKRVPGSVSASLLNALELRSGDRKRPAALSQAIREGAGFPHLDVGQRNRLVRMAHADMKVADASEELLGALSSRFEHLDRDQCQAVLAIVQGVSPREAAMNASLILAQDGVPLSPTESAALVKKLHYPGMNEPTIKVMEAPGFAKLSEEHRQALIDFMEIKSPTGMWSEGWSNLPRESLKALAHGMSHMDAENLRKLVDSLPVRIQEELVAAFLSNLEKSSLWGGWEAQARLTQGFAHFEQATSHGSVREAIKKAQEEIQARYA
ncbi:hypothetical protein [Acidovorax anthurii]|uniref:Uncharacterized protein n=2 Tax=Paracidovorax anthurii TaxID=78229 RepID=A0A328Z354_9BURK|nr:hypothetical protein AX018_104431 [Paracidovorax anthurii]